MAVKKEAKQRTAKSIEWTTSSYLITFQLRIDAIFMTKPFKRGLVICFGVCINFIGNYRATTRQLHLNSLVISLLEIVFIDGYVTAPNSHRQWEMSRDLLG